MTDLAGSQGGSDVGEPAAHASGSKGESPGAHAQSSASDNNMEDFIKRGEKVLHNFVQGMKGFEDIAKRFQTLKKTVATLQITLQNSSSNRSGNGENTDETPGPSGSKKRKTDSATPISVDVSDSGSDVSDTDSNSDDCLDDIDNVMNTNETEDIDDEDDFLEECQEFFQAEKTCGQDVHEGVARTINMALRGTINKEKMKTVLDRNKRPENIPALQIPRIPQNLWGQLTNNTKSLDASRQKMIGQSNQALIPVVKAMNHLKEQKEPDIKTLTVHISDAFKILASQVTTVNQDRRETIRQELTPQFKDLCGENNPISATQLFGDNFAETVKSMDQGKTVKMTMKSQSDPFLGRQGERINKSQPHNKPPPKHTPTLNKIGSKRSRPTGKISRNSNKSSKARPNQHRKKNYHV